MHLLFGEGQLIVCAHDKKNSFLMFSFLILEIPKLPPIPQMEFPDESLDAEDREEDDDEPAARATNVKRNLKTSGPKVVDPYTEDPSSSLMPLLIGIVAILPIIFCLCRL
jgi:hypothetical protein